jgi:Leucine-rich repeat (LRR) protein
MRKNFIPLIFIPLFLLTTLQSKTQTRTQDSLALVDLYNSTNGPGWSSPFFWLTNKPIDQWAGITVRNNRVVEISLSSTNLTGNIPESIGNLDSLSKLYLGSNNLTGGLPVSIGKLVHLTILSLTSNQLTGTIPSSIGNLIELKSLSFFRNKLSGSIPDSIKNLTKLNELDLYSNALTGEITPALGDLSELIIMDLSGNLFTGTIPSSFTKLSKLRNLLIYRNQLSGNIPPFIFTLPELEDIELDRNQFTGSIPDSAVNVTKINEIWLNGNQRSGAIPDWLANSLVVSPKLHNNNFNFEGMEALVSKKIYSLYAPQNKIPLNYNNHILSVSAGGTLSNDTFRLYKNNVLIETKTGDSTFSVNSFTATDSFYISVTNAIATQLTLYTQTRSLSSGYYTIASGNWNDTAIWVGGAVPPPTADVTIMNSVTVDSNVTCYSLTVVPPGGSVVVQTGFNLTVTH